MLILSLVLFFLALETMKAGAKDMRILSKNLTKIHGPLKGLGLGWLSSYLTLSGSPIAAVALALFDIDTINNPTAFSMVVGSRLGASPSPWDCWCLCPSEDIFGGKTSSPTSWVVTSPPLLIP